MTRCFYALLFVVSFTSLVIGCGETTTGKKDPGNFNDQFTPSGSDQGVVDGGQGNTDGTGQATGADGTESQVNPTAGETTGDTGGGTEPTLPPFDGIVGFPSQELNLQIVGPSARDNAATGGAITYVAGILFGNAKDITWQSSTGQSGEATGGGGFWKTGPISLNPGDNVITVKAVSDARESIDSVTITYNPGFFLQNDLKMRPSALFTQQSTKVLATIALNTKNLVDGSVTIWEVDQNGNNVGKLGQMLDDGLTSSETCDEIQDDGVFSRCFDLQSPAPAIRRFRVNLQVQVEGTVVQVYSPIQTIEIIEPVTVADCQAMNQLQKDAKAMYAAEITGGNAQAGSAVVQMLKGNPLVANAGVNETGRGVWVQFQGGVLGALNLPTPGQRGGGYGSHTGALVGNAIPIESKNVLALAPFNQSFGGLDEVPQIAQMLTSQQCPKFTVDGPHLNGASTLSLLRGAYNYGVMMMSTHGDTYFEGLPNEIKSQYNWEHDGSQEIVWTGHAVACNELAQTMATCSSDSECGSNSECVLNDSSGFGAPTGVCVDHTQVDLRRGRIVMGADTYGVHPHFFARHAKRQWPSSLVYLGGCRTMYSGTLAAELFGVGVKAIAGFSDYISSAFASEQAKNWFSKMLNEEKATGQAALFPVGDPENPSGMFSLFGGSNVVVTDSQILNPGFEKGDTTSWNVEGDGRVISQLGISIPVGGKFMGILSTGLGYTQQTGELNQSFCIPQGTSEVSFYWKFFSEEFKEWCGSSYQDTFKATLETSSGQITLVDVKVDDLCPAEECTGCGSKYVGLVAADVAFDQGGVYNTQWQNLSKDISAFAGGGPVTLRLFATDQGDSIYDTVILVDSVEFD